MRVKSPGFAARRQSGFSLMEILIVVGIIAAIMAFAASQIFGGRDQANVRLAATQLESLAAKVEQYRMDTGQILQPRRTGDQSGGQRLAGPLRAQRQGPERPWGQPLQIRVPGANGEFELVSFGSDRKAGGDSTAADIVKP